MENTSPSPAKNSYCQTSPDEAAGTHFYAETVIAPAAVVRCFGDGDQGDGCKISRNWVFRKGDLVFTLYDWKSTDLYERGTWTSEEMWSSKEPFPLHIGSREPATREDALDFADYLQKVTSE